ncbi:MAG: hypothetical protein JRI25_11105 [Deltaproteobacteria bacterium]|nr:hypothetical protein [Deltaproteobacteria bacterium]
MQRLIQFPYLLVEGRRFDVSLQEPHHPLHLLEGIARGEHRSDCHVLLGEALEEEQLLQVGNERVVGVIVVPHLGEGLVARNQVGCEERRVGGGGPEGEARNRQDCEQVGGLVLRPPLLEVHHHGEAFPEEGRVGIDVQDHHGGAALHRRGGGGEILGVQGGLEPEIHRGVVAEPHRFVRHQQVGRHEVAVAGVGERGDVRGAVGIEAGVGGPRGVEHPLPGGVVEDPGPLRLCAGEEGQAQEREGRQTCHGGLREEMDCAPRRVQAL